MSEMKVEDLRQVVGEVLRNLEAGTIDSKASLQVLRDMLKGFNLSDLEGLVAAVHFMMANSAKHDVDDVSLFQEIQQLGLSRESAGVICDPYRKSKDRVREQLIKASYRLNSLTSVEWRVDQVLASCDGDMAASRNETEKMAVMKLGLSDGAAVFEISQERLDVLIHELKQAQALMRR